MTNLTFAIEAAKRGCPYVKDKQDGNPRFRAMGQMQFVDCISKDTRFVIGATLALWLEEKASETEDEWDALVKPGEITVEHENYLGEIANLQRWAADARSFAKGL